MSEPDPWKILAIFFFWLPLLFGSILIGAYMHEEVHQMIFTNYNISSHIDMFGHGTALTIPENKTLSHDDYMSMEKLQIENDMLGYNLAPLELLTSFILLFTMFKVGGVL